MKRIELRKKNKRTLKELSLMGFRGYTNKEAAPLNTAAVVHVHELI